VSFDMMLLDPDSVPTAEEIYDILESDEPDAPLGARMRAVIDECSTRWPGEDTVGNWTEAPWASWPLARETAPPVIEVNIQWEHAKVMLPALIEIAGRHGIVLFDPQTSEVHLPARLA
jgi:hypothetical protein